MSTYPPEALAPDGQLWWKVRIWPGKKRAEFGVEPRLAAWFNYNIKVGDIFTLKMLRQALGEEDLPNNHEHFNRRLRNLRKYGWAIHSSRDLRGLEQDQYQLATVGHPIWLGKSRFGTKGVSNKIRREIFDRDGHRCIICGVGQGEPYPDDPTRLARLTLGHFVADAFKGPNDPANLRTECSRCNEPAKEEATRSLTAQELWPKIRSLGRQDKARLLSWIEKGHRERDEVDRLFDDYRALPALQRDEIKKKLSQAVKGEPEGPL
jgi:5-methylcytosine-specific restriction endonuclease McrA